MNASARILAAGLVDLDGIVGTCGVDVTWAALAQQPPGTGATMRAVFDKADATFRRLDLPSRALVLACEAAGVGAALTDEERQHAGLFVDTSTGSLASDRRFSASLGDEMVAAGVFPFTLPSTTLGEVALRYGLRGPTISWSVPERGAEGVREALRLFAAGELEHAVVGVVDADERGRYAALVAVLAPCADGELSWGDDAPFERVRARLRRRAPRRPDAFVLGCDVVDGEGITGTSGTATTWRALGQAAPGTGRTVRRLFGKVDPTFRRLDAPGRALVLACEAAGVASVLDDAQRQLAAILVETDVGALQADLQFTASLDDEALAVSVFPFVLTTTCLGEVALRYGIRGPTCSHSIRGGSSAQRGESVREALRLFASGEAEHAVVGVVETLPEAACGRAAVLRAVVAVLARRPDGALGEVCWPAGQGDPFAELAALCGAR